MKAANIQWDTDGDENILSSLPSEIEIPEDITEDEVSDYISKVIGYCHTGFELT